MADPKSVSELNNLFEAFKKSIDQQFSQLKDFTKERFDSANTKIYFVVTLLLGMLAFSYSINKEVGETRTVLAVVKTDGEATRKDAEAIRKDVDVIKKDTAETKDRIAKLDVSALAGAIGSATGTQSDIKQSLTRIEGLIGNLKQPPPPPTPSPRFSPIIFDSKEMELVREFIPTKKGSREVLVKVGSPAPNSAVLTPTPEKLVGLMPKLKATRYYVDDAGGLVVFVSARDNVIVGSVSG